MYRFSVHTKNLEFWRENIFRHILGLKKLILTKWMLISGTPLMKENENYSHKASALVLITIYIDLILRMNQAVYVNLSVKTVITFFMECPLYDNIRSI